MANLIRLVYNCTTHFRFGNEHCPRHTIHKSTVDEHVFSTLDEILRSGSFQLGEIERRIDEDAITPDIMTKQRETLQQRIAAKKDEVKDYARQLARRLIDEQIFEELSQEAREEVVHMDYENANGTTWPRFGVRVSRISNGARFPKDAQA